MLLNIVLTDDLSGGFVDLETGEVHGKQDDSNEEGDSEGSNSASENGKFEELLNYKKLSIFEIFKILLSIILCIYFILINKCP